MPNLPQLVSSDERPPLHRLRRAQLHRIADRENITYPAGAPATAMYQLLEAAGITGLEPKYADITFLKPFVQQDENGNQHVEHYPVPPEHHTAGKSIDYDTHIEQAAERAPKEVVESQNFDNERIKELERRNHELASENNELRHAMESRLSALEAQAGGIDFPLERLLPWQLKEMCKNRDLPYKHLEKDELLEILREGDGHTTAGRERGPEESDGN